MFADDESMAIKKNKPNTKRRITGVVASDKMDKTVVVVVSRRLMDRRFSKYQTKRKRYKAHDELNQCRVGDVVELLETRPLSREKCWGVVRLINRPEAVHKTKETVE